MASSDVSVTGIGESAIGKTPNKNSLNLYSDACIAAIRDAELSKEDIDGVLTAYSLVDPQLMHSTMVSDYLGINPDITTSLDVGGATPYVGVCHAANAIRQGKCDNVLVAFGDNRKTGFKDSEATNTLTNVVGHSEFEDPFGPTVPALYAMIAQRYMDQYEVSADTLARIAVTCRHHAALRGEGQETEPIDVKDVRESPPIAEPLRMLDCALISDGAGAVVVSSRESAKESRHPVNLIGYGEGHGSKYLTRRDELLESPAKRSGSAAFEMAGCTPSDIDVAQLYDCFTITPLMLLEELGFCDPGEASHFVDEQGISVGDELPLNTHGGLLSYAGAGVFHIIEAVRQIRGEAEETQVEDAETALAHGLGGILSTHSTLIFAEADP